MAEETTANSGNDSLVEVLYYVQSSSGEYCGHTADCFFVPSRPVLFGKKIVKDTLGYPLHAPDYFLFYDGKYVDEAQAILRGERIGENIEISPLLKFRRSDTEIRELIQKFEEEKKQKTALSKTSADIEARINKILPNQ